MFILGPSNDHSKQGLVKCLGTPWISRFRDCLGDLCRGPFSLKFLSNLVLILNDRFDKRKDHK